MSYDIEDKELTEEEKNEAKKRALQNLKQPDEEESAQQKGFKSIRDAFKGKK